MTRLTLAAALLIAAAPRVWPVQAGQADALATFRAVVLVDVTASLDAQLGTGRAATDARAAIEQWLDSTEPLAGEWMFGRVDRQPQLGVAFSSDREALRASARALFAVDDDHRYGPSPVWDTIDLALASLSRPAVPVRGRVVVLTDGRVSGNRIGVAELIAHARAARVPIDVVSRARDDVFEFSRNTALLVQPQLALEQLAKATGGRYIPRDAAPLAAHLASLSAEWRGRSLH